MKYIGVLDCNNFFVSCERLFRPDLRGKPVLVLSSNDGCVVARSQEVKDMDIPMGVPYFKVKDMLKKASVTVFSSHFTLYRDISRRVFEVVEIELPSKEQYSIDEAFFSFEAESKEAGEVELRRIKQVVEMQVGIPVSIGVAASKTQAKYANRLAKKQGGVVLLTQADWQVLTATIPLSDIWGVGGRMMRRYREAGLLTVGDLIECPSLRLDTIFGINGLRLQAELAGKSVHLVAGGQSVEQQSIMSSRSFKNTTESLSVLNDAIAYHVRQAAADLRSMGLLAATLQVSIVTSRHGDFMLRGGRDMVQLVEPTDDTAALISQAIGMVARLFESGVPYKKAGIMLGRLLSPTGVQTSLFQSVAPVRPTKALMGTIDALNERFGRDMVQVGRQTALQMWSSGRADLSPAYTTNWSMVPVVRTA